MPRTRTTKTSKTAQRDVVVTITQPLPSEVAAVRPPSKLAQLIALLQHEDGVTITELCDATGWQPHSVRGAMAGSLRKKGHIVISARAGGVRRYRLGSAT